MSEIIHIVGKLYEIHPRITRTLQEICKDIIDERGIDISEYNYKYHKGDYMFILADALDREYIIIDGRLFNMNSVNVEPDDEILHFDYNESDKSFDFECKFYNGGTCLTEILEEGYQKYYKK